MVDLIHNLVKDFLLLQELRDTVKEVLLQGLLGSNRGSVRRMSGDLLHAWLLSHFLQVVLDVRRLERNRLVDLVRHLELTEATGVGLLDHPLILDHKRSP